MTRIAILAALAAMGVTAAARGQAPCNNLSMLLHDLNNPMPALADHFGSSVAISGKLAVVGAERDDPASVHIFDVTTGEILLRLYNPETIPSNSFGASVAISGNLVLVGASTDSPGGVLAAGTAYVFDATTGALLATLNSPEPTASGYFGCSVALSGDLAVVGAFRESPDGVYFGGAAYVFDVRSGALQAVLNNPAPVIGNYFGYSVAISGNLAVVGAYAGPPSGETVGRAYVFDATTGVLETTLNNPTPWFGDFFGISVGISGNLAIVGAEADDPGGFIDGGNEGTAYLFDATAGTLIATLNNPAPAEGDYFGHSVAVFENLAVVGAFMDNPGGVSNAGTAYIFDAATGGLLAILDNPAPRFDDVFGDAVAISENVAIVGALQDSAGGVWQAGTAYIFGCPPPTPTPSPTPSLSPSPTHGHAHHTPHGPSPTPSATPSASVTPLSAPSAASEWANYE